MKINENQPAEGIPSQNKDKIEKPVEQITDQIRDTGNVYFDFFKIEKEDHTLFGLKLAPGVNENPYFKYCTFHVESGDFVKRGQKIFTFSNDNIFLEEPPKHVPFNAPQDGYFEKFVSMPFMDNRYVTLEAIFFAVFTDSLSRFKEIFSFEIIEEVDEFTKERKICFSVVGFPKPHLFKFYGNAAGYRTPHKYISFSYYFGFQIENVSGSDFIIFRFDKEFRLSEGDTINFLFDNQEILKFEITGKPFTIYRNSTKGFKLPLFVEDIELFKSNSVVKTRVHFKEENFWSEFSRGNNNVAEKDFQYVIQQMFFLYANEIKERINDYKPLSRLDEVPVEIRKSDFCYVYLMEDKANNFFKIGISNKPDFREKTLQSEKPSIEMVCFKKYPTRRMAESFEKALHRSFKDKHIRGEWFNLSVDEINEIVETLK